MIRAVLIALALVLVGCSAPNKPLLQQLPADGKLLDGDSAPFVAAERYRGKVVVLDFWAGWCKECVRTVPQIVRLAEAFAKEGLVVVGVNAGEGATEAAGYAKELGIGYPIALDPELVFSDRLGAGNLPMLVVVDRAGNVVHRAKHVDAATLVVIRKLLASP